MATSGVRSPLEAAAARIAWVEAHKWHLYGALWGGTVVVGTLVGVWMGSAWAGFLTALIVCAVCVGYAILVASWHVRRATRAEVGTVETHRVERLLAPICRKAGIAQPPVLIIPTAAGNACASGVLLGQRFIGVTSGALGCLNDLELTAVLAHEVSHTRRQDALYAGWWAALIGLTGWAAAALMVVGVSIAVAGSRSRRKQDQEAAMAGLGIAALAAIAGAVAIVLLQIGSRAGMRQRETLADDEAVLWTGRALPLASALGKMAAQPPLSGMPSALGLMFSTPTTGHRGWGWLFSTHPPTEARIRRLHELAVATGEVV